MITIGAARLVTADTMLDRPVIAIEGGKVVSISVDAEQDEVPLTHDFRHSTLTAGLLDVHMHGAVGHDVMDSETDSFRRIGRFLAQHGIAEYLATTATTSMDYTLHALDRIARHVEAQPVADEARMRGIHIEGPFLSHAKRGMHPPQFLVPPTPNVLKKLWEAARGRIVLMTIAPELPGALETIAHANELGIRCSIGHSNANAEETLRALAAGAVSATHTYNAMRPLDHREPGILGIVLDRDDIYSDLICDGVHVAPELVRLWFKAKGPQRSILITDSLEATGMPNGVYKLGETTIRVEGGRCTTEEGVLAGSVISLSQAVANMQAFTGADLPTAVRLASRNPARMLGWADDVQIGSEANFNVYTSGGQHQNTILRGNLLADIR